MRIILLLFLLNSCFVFGSSKDHILKIYVNDAYSGKKITDVKVTLEGFELPEIVGKYDLKGKYYYFNQIPTGYNTVMTYHKNYNEKGVQFKNGFPEKIILNLYDSLNVIYDLNNKINNSKNITDNHCKVYVEDPYKIAIEFNENCVEVLSDVLKICPELKAINPFYRSNRNNNLDFSCDEFTATNNFPTIGGYDNFSAATYTNSVDDYPVLMFRKTDGSKFKRFNDPILHRLSINNLQPLIIVNLKVNYKGNKKYKRSFTKKLDQANYNKNDKDAMIYKGKAATLIGKNRYLPSDLLYRPNGETVQVSPHRFFYLIWNIHCATFYQQNGEDLNPDLINMKYFGLGYLDQLVYFSEIYNLTITNEIDQIYKNCNN